MFELHELRPQRLQRQPHGRSTSALNARSGQVRAAMLDDGELSTAESALLLGSLATMVATLLITLNAFV
ncbi:MAG: hypothetical protein AAF648_04080 [Pseudomonadota bacterium]